MIRERDLVEAVLDCSRRVNPEYTHNEHLGWALGFLARYVLIKNNMDNRVFAQLNHELNQRLKQSRYIEMPRR